MRTRSHSRRKRQHYVLPEPGSSPGQVYIDKNSVKPVITVYKYNANTYDVQQLENLSSVAQLITDKNFTFWIDIKGFNSTELFDTLSNGLKINKLVLEDITHTYQRPNLEEYDHYVYATSRMMLVDKDKNLDNEQVSFILMDNALFSLQDQYSDCMNPVRQRLEAGKGSIRTAGSSYILYALMDIIVDTYFEILGEWGEDLDKIEDRLFEQPDKTIMFDTQHVKRNLIAMRRVAWPERDKLNDMLRSDSPLITDQTKMYVRDTYDHCIQIIDIIESLKEISASNLDMYLSIISNRMNEIMKVLTIMSSIFIPLTFIAGIYGMNFARQDPVTNKVMPYNMPELYTPHGYLIAMVIMLVIAAFEVIYFWRKGWFK